ncbi:hypothetical protein SY86_25595 [Erwinia tracheiphila]|uniref:Uncharacterized protein n=2 Tax=Erwinia tracheiphila TaxID=65700 RepID=A0A0M2KAN1_9GAMM|nr:hypothetical protein AV903_01500 [Erwinia tracheiphila]EOS92873.1 hypothetical protein ETR_22109 [Erwinia tracheiphila PSU-1]KKF34332.1 hypothetical protein SY86_25595 [Erwinia tracheiphila]
MLACGSHNLPATVINAMPFKSKLTHPQNLSDEALAEQVFLRTKIAAEACEMNSLILFLSGKKYLFSAAMKANF